MSFKWTAPTKKDKAQSEAPAAPVVAAGGVEVDAVICRLRTMADMGVRLELDLPELTPEMFALLYALRGKAIKVTLK